MCMYENDESVYGRVLMRVVCMYLYVNVSW